MIRRAPLLLCLLGMSACTSHTAANVPKGYIQYNTGTGFFVNDEGYLITNHHVVRPCEGGYSAVTEGKSIQATLIGIDKERDLALLRAQTQGQRAGVFNALNVMPPPGENLTIIGYPGDAWKKGIAVTRGAKLLAMRGPRGETHMLQFSDSVKQGNSGGPLLDSAGNVLGVISAKATVTRINRRTDKVESVTKTDVAIRPDAVWNFLDKYRVRYFRAESATRLSQKQITQKARQFIVNVRCPID